MSELLPFVVVGLASGAIYGLAGTGLVLTYRTSGVFNFAHGGIATLAAYGFYELHEQRAVAWPLAAAASIAVVGTVGGVGLELLARRLAPATSAMKVVATVGLLLVIQGLMTVRYGTGTFSLPQYLPTSSFRLPGVNVGYDQLIVVIVGVAITFALSTFLRTSRRGIAMRGVVDSPSLLELTGIDAPGIRRQAWIIGSSVAAASGILIAPTLGLDPILLTFLVVQAFGAAALGRFRSLPVTFAGGLGIGVAAAIGQRYATDFPNLLGLPPSLPFIVLIAVLVFAKPGSLAEVGTPRKERRERLSPLPAAPRSALAALGALVVVLIPTLVGSKLPVFVSAAAYVIIFISLGLLLKLSGQISLCHAAFVAIGAAAFGKLISAGMPWPLALLGAGLAAVPLGAAVALPAVRLPGVFLALATFGFGILLERMAYRSFLMFGKEGALGAPRPELIVDFSSDRAYFYLAVGLAVAAAMFVIVLQRGRLGRLLRGVADSPVALQTFGASVTTALVLVCCLSAFLAGIGGAVLAAGNGAAGGTGLGALQSLLWLALVAATGRRVIPAAVVAAVFLAVLPIYLPDAWVDYQTVGFGVAAITIALARSSGFDLAARIKRDLLDSDRRRRSPFAERAAISDAPTRIGSRRPHPVLAGEVS